MTEAELVARAVAGQQDAFDELVAGYRRPVFRHCYRMLGSGSDAEDATQDTLERAWRGLAGYDGSGPFGGWLHRIATNVCLDTRRAAARRPVLVSVDRLSVDRLSVDRLGEPEAWVEPVRDEALFGPGDPLDAVLRNEEISLAFVAALQLLAPRQRAALLLHDVLGFSHGEVAEVLEISPGAVNSLLSRARETVRRDAGDRQPASTDPLVQDLLRRYLRAWRLADIDGLLGVVTDDVALSMPPALDRFDGSAAVAAFVEAVIFGPSRPAGVAVWPGSCNGQPAVANYWPDASGSLVVAGVQILQLAMVDGSPLVAEIVSYRDPDLAVRCGFPACYPG
ncbi:MAG TPA: RNA polymerase subunit sigma-70 [Jatrophihabitans sp.]|nr:RNA polymerase subunit sigma-70 [Jatrophihabitans sp.]